MKENSKPSWAEEDKQVIYGDPGLTSSPAAGITRGALLPVFRHPLGATDAFN